MPKKVLMTFVFLVSMASCVLQKKTSSFSIEKAINASPLSENAQIGVYIVDASDIKVIFEKNASKNFVPASNAKILTLYSCVKTLGDSLSSFEYNTIDNEITILPNADPTFLHPDFDGRKAFDFLKKFDKVHINCSNFSNFSSLGSGWAWDDYNDYYQTEVTAFPIYGNIVRFNFQNDSIKIYPTKFRNNIIKDSTLTHVHRDEYQNTFRFPANFKTNFKQDVPINLSGELFQKLLSDTLKTEVDLVGNAKVYTSRKFHSMPVDTVYRRMMQVSDNMLAEHLLLMAGNAVMDTLETTRAIKYITEKYLGFLPQKIRWVDGSGLSRYNLISPIDLVSVLQKLYESIDHDRLFSWFPAGGVSGTLRRFYKAEKPYVFAKTGSFSGVYNESGYLITASGKTLIYSFMSNNFTTTISETRQNMQEIITKIHENY